MSTKRNELYHLDTQLKWFQQSLPHQQDYTTSFDIKLRTLAHRFCSQLGCIASALVLASSRTEPESGWGTWTRMFNSPGTSTRAREKKHNSLVPSFLSYSCQNHGKAKWRIEWRRERQKSSYTPIGWRVIHLEAQQLPLVIRLGLGSGQPGRPETSQGPVVGLGWNRRTWGYHSDQEAYCSWASVDWSWS